MNLKASWRPAVTLGVALSVLLAACSGGSSPSPSTPTSSASASAGGVNLDTVPPAPNYSGAIAADGATFPQPVYEEWLSEYNQAYNSIQISYAGGGSGQGIKDITANTVQFAGSDAPMKPDEQQAAEAKNGPILHIPTVFGGIVIAYNLDGNPKLSFSPDVIGKIFTGQITKWNDPAIAADNTGVNLPSTSITVAHRSDGSGTTNAFTSWLCGVSEDWKAKVNPCSGKEVAWPVGLGGSGNPGVTTTISSTPGAVGYIELAYAVQNNITYGKVKNKSGNFIDPSLDSVAAAANFDTVPDTLTFQAWDTSVADGYPITTATWILVYQQQDKVGTDQARAEAVVHFLIWALDKGGDAAKQLNYAVLPDKIRTAALAKVATITWSGTPIVNDLYK